MGRRLTSHDDLGGTAVEFLDNWKEAGFLKLVLHKDPPWIRDLHNFRRIFKKEGKDGIEKKVLWYPWVCWEEEAFHKLTRMSKDDPPVAKLCPGCRLFAHIRGRDDLKDEDVIFRFVGTGRNELHEIMKIDFIGKGEGKLSFKDDFTPRTDYVIPVISLDDPTKVAITNEKWSLGKALYNRIKKDRQLYGADDGDPSRTPIAYTFEFDKSATGASAYSVSRLEKVTITDRIRELWESEAPDASKYVNRGNPKKLLEEVQQAMEAAEMEFPLEEIFAPSLQAWNDDEDSDESTSFDPAELDKEEDKPKKGQRMSPPPAKPKAKETERKPKAKKPEPEPEPEAEPDADVDPAPEKPARPARAAKKPAPPPEPEPEPEEEVQIFACSECDADFPSNVDTCPSCGAKDDGAEEAPPAPEKKKPLGKF